MSAYTRIVVGTDGSETASRAVDRAARIAADTSAQLLLVTAYEPESREVVKEARDALHADEAFLVVGSAPAESALRDAADRARALGAEKTETRAVEGKPVSVIDQVVAEVGADLLVVGNVGLNTLSGRILGSVPQAVARRSGVDTLIVHTVD